MTITEERLKWSQADGGIEGVILRAEGTYFVLSVRTKEEEKTLVKSKKVNGKYEVRRFSNALEALRLLHKAGTQVVQIDLSLWRPEDEKLARTRPDRSEYMKGLHARGKTSENDRTTDVGVATGISNNLNIRHQKLRPPIEPKRGIPVPLDTFNPLTPDES